MDALINYPGMGSLWLDDAYVEGQYVVGRAWDAAQRQTVLMNFPLTCVRKWGDST
jgi:hypothetical protein